MCDNTGMVDHAAWLVMPGACASPLSLVHFIALVPTPRLSQEAVRPLKLKEI